MQTQLTLHLDNQHNHFDFIYSRESYVEPF